MKAFKTTLKVLFLFVFLFVLYGCNNTEDEEIVIWAWNRNVQIMEAAIEMYQDEIDETFQARVESFSQGDIDVKFKTSANLNRGEDMADIILGDAMKMRGYYDLWPDLFYVFNDTDISIIDKERFVSSTVDLVEIEEGIFAIPFGIAPTVVFAYVPLWDLTVLEDILENGWTWDDYKQIGLDIKASDQSVYMTAYNMRGDDRIYRTMTSQRGEWFVDQDLNVQVGNTNSISTMTRIQDMLDLGVIGHVDTGDYRSLMVAGKIAAQIQGFFLGGQIKDVGQTTSGDWRILPLPSWEEEESSVSITGGSYLYVNNLRSSKSKAAEFVKWISLSDDAAVNGLEVGGIFPALLSSYSTNYFNQPDPFFGNQVYLADVAENLADALPIFPCKYNAENYNSFIQSQEKILFNQAPIVQELENAKNAILSNIQ